MGTAEFSHHCNPDRFAEPLLTGSQLVLLQDVAAQCPLLAALPSRYRHRLTAERMRDGQCVAKSIHGGGYEAVEAAQSRCVLPSPEHWVTVSNATAGAAPGGARARPPLEMPRSPVAVYSMTLWVAGATAAGLLGAWLLWLAWRWWARRRRGLSLKKALSKRASELRHLRSFKTKLDRRYRATAKKPVALDPLPALRVGTAPPEAAPGNPLAREPSARGLFAAVAARLRKGPAAAPPPKACPARASGPRPPSPAPPARAALSPKASLRFSPRTLRERAKITLGQLPSPRPLSPRPDAAPDLTRRPAADDVWSWLSRDAAVELDAPAAVSPAEAAKSAGLLPSLAPPSKLSPRRLTEELRHSLNQLPSPRRLSPHLSPRHSSAPDPVFEADAGRARSPAGAGDSPHRCGSPALPLAGRGGPPLSKDYQLGFSQGYEDAKAAQASSPNSPPGRVCGTPIQTTSSKLLRDLLEPDEEDLCSQDACSQAS